MISNAHHEAVVAELRAQIARGQRQYDELLAKYHSLRPTHGPTRTEKPAMHQPPPPADEIALVSAERMAIEAMTQDFIRNGLSPDAASKEAQRVAAQFNASGPAPLY